MPSSRRIRRTAWVTRAATLCAALAPVMALAQPAPPAAAPPAAPAAPEAPPPGLWINGIHLSAQIEGGFMGNPARPRWR